MDPGQGKDNLTYLEATQLQLHKNYAFLGPNVKHAIQELGALNEGAFGMVRHCLLTIHGRREPMQVAVKSVKDEASKEMEDALRSEIAILENLPQHKNVVGMVGHIQYGGHPHLIMEYCNKGDVRAFLRKIKENPRGSRPLAVRTLIRFAFDIASGMAHLARNNIIHRDLALRNCLLSEEDVVKVTDFGLSRLSSGIYKKLSDGKVPWKWLAPEALNLDQNTYSTKTDVWAFGIVLYEIFTLGQDPFPEYTGVDNLKLLARMQDPRRPLMDKPAQCPDKVYEIMLQCWNTNPDLRPPFFLLARQLEYLLEIQNSYLKLLAGEDESYAFFHIPRN